jgi:hypothetical protein
MDRLICQHNMGCTLRHMGSVEEAAQRMFPLIPQLVAMGEPDLEFNAEDCAAVLADLGAYTPAVRLWAVADAQRQRKGVPREPVQDGQIVESIVRARPALTREDWERAYESGQRMNIEEALIEAQAVWSQGHPSRPHEPSCLGFSDWLEATP